MNSPFLEDNDLKIISSLRNDSRSGTKGISEKLNIPERKVREIIENSEKNGIVKRHTALLDFKKAGFPVNAAIIFGASKVKYTDMGEYLEKHKNVNSLHKITGNRYIAEVVFEETAHLLKFIETMESMFKTETEMYLFTNELKKEEFLR